MVIELKSEQISVQFNSFGGALSSIKDAEGLEYFNDDVFVARPLPKEHFFHANGIASLFIAVPSLSYFTLNCSIFLTGESIVKQLFSK